MRPFDSTLTLDTEITPAKVEDQPVDAAEFQIAPEYGPNLFRFLSTIEKLAILEFVAKRHHATDPEPFALGGGDLVADALGRDLALELGEGQQHVERQTPHRGGGVELLGDRDEGHTMGIEQLHQLGEVGQRAGEPVDLVDDDESTRRALTSASRCCRAGRSVDPPEKPPSSYRLRSSDQPA